MGDKIIKVTAGIIPGENGTYLIAQRRKGTRFGGQWEFPGGTVEEYDKSYEDCLRRELKEELNITPVVGDFFMETIHDYGHKKVKIRCYWIRSFSGEIQLMAHDRYEWELPTRMEDYRFVEADLPFVKKLRKLENSL